MSKIQMEHDSTVPGFFKESGKEKMIKEIWGMSTNHKVWASSGFWFKLSRRNDIYDTIGNFTYLNIIRINFFLL